MKIDHLVILASDLSKSVPWYDALFAAIGFEKIRDHVYTDRAGVAVDLRQAGEPERGYRRFAPGLNHFGVAAASRAEVDRVADAMRAAGFDVSDTQEIGTHHCLFMKDRDGMRVEIAFAPEA
ncbi:MAG: hypothetical protein Tsb0010_06260 [Parvularculaceae bacterium]